MNNEDETLKKIYVQTIARCILAMQIIGNAFDMQSACVLFV